MPDHLFYYRHLPTGFSRVTNPYANRRASSASSATWTGCRPASGPPCGSLTGLGQRLERLEARQRGLPYRLADRLRAACGWLVSQR
ncbi:MAG: hypothetical protein U0797_08475 [Gemmataceae bacterium]